MKRLLLVVSVLFCYRFCPAQELVKLPFDITLTRPDSTQISSAELLKNDGRPTVLAFWLTTCMPCQAEFAAYSAQWDEWTKQADFRFFAISTDFPNRFNRIAPMAEANKWPFPVYWDGFRAFRAVLPGGLNGLPQVFLFDKNGELVWQHRKYRPGDEQELFAKILEAAQ